jgi:glycosyltransferase involved in cell wall biosynthesis
MFLLGLLRWLLRNSDISFEVVLGSGGGLESEFAALAPVTIFSQLDRKGILAWKSRLSNNEISLVYSNTITNGRIQNFLSFLDCPVICHVHELEKWMRYHIAPDDLRFALESTDLFIADSDAVRNNLIEHHGVDPFMVRTVYPFIETEGRMPPDEENLRQLRVSLGIPSNSFVVGAGGTTDWRKGPDIFVQLARATLRKSKRPVHFIWVGGDAQGEQYGALAHDAEKAGIGHSMCWVGHVSNFSDYFALFDVFALVSREDPFPLVNLEAAFLEKPVLCFDKSGGAAEFVGDDCGFVVPYLDVEEMSNKILLLMESPELYRKLAQRAAEKVRESHSDATAPRQLWQIILSSMDKKYLDRSGSRT